MYKVYFLDGYEITDVEDVQFGHERNIKVHNGLGQGSFPVADDKDLKTWTIKCEQEETSLFDTLEKLLNSKEASRLVITSDAERISEPVLLKGYNRAETSSGVYEVTIQFIEHKAVNVKTTDIPYIARPGKVPIPPKTIVFGGGGGNTPYKVVKTFEKASSEANGVKNRVELYESEFGEMKYDKADKLYISEFCDVKTGKPIKNQCLLENGKPYYYDEKRGAIVGQYFGKTDVVTNINVKNKSQATDVKAVRAVAKTAEEIGRARQQAQIKLAQEQLRKNK